MTYTKDVYKRQELDIRHSQGFHPHPIISIVLPLPVGQSSDCELLDFEVTQETDGAGIAEKLNGGLPEGLTILDCYEARRPVRELTYLQADMELDYDRGVPHGAAQALTELLRRRELLIEKRTKRKQLAEVDIAPMIRDISFTQGENVLRAAVTVQAQNPGLNPQLLEKAIARYPVSYTHLPPGGGAADAPAHPAGRAAGNDCRPAAAAGRLLCRLPPGTAGLAGGDPRPAGDPGGGAGGAGQRGVHYSGGGSGGGFARGVPVLRHHGPGGVFHHRQLSPDHGLLPPPAGNAAGQGPGCQGESQMCIRDRARHGGVHHLSDNICCTGRPTGEKAGGESLTSKGSFAAICPKEWPGC